MNDFEPTLASPSDPRRIPGIDATEQPPDWASIDRELVCPLCEYNLRGLTVAKCPECGAQHTWADLLDPRRREHPYLFEHHPERNAWSFCRTLIGGLRPQTFWTTLSPLQPTSLSRMLLYGALVLGISVSLYMVAVAGQVFALQELGGWRWGGAWGRVNSLSLIDGALAMIGSADFLIACLTPIVWAGVTFLSFMLFDVSMHRARVKRVHIARAVIYAFDVVFLMALGHAAYDWIYAGLLWLMSGEDDADSLVGFIWVVSVIASYFWLTARAEFRRKRWAATILWPVLAIAVITGVMVTDAFQFDMRLSRLIGTPVPFSAMLVLLSYAVITGRLIVAFRQYLQFKHSVAVVIASQVITALAIPAAGVVIQTFASLF